MWVDVDALSGSIPRVSRAHPARVFPHVSVASARLREETTLLHTVIFHTSTVNGTRVNSKLHTSLRVSGALALCTAVFALESRTAKHLCLKHGQQSHIRSDCAVDWALNSSRTPSLFLKDGIIYLVLEVPAHYFSNFFLFLCLFFWDSYTSVWSRLFFDAFVHFLSTGSVYKRKQKQNKMSASKMKKDHIKLRLTKLSTARKKIGEPEKPYDLFSCSLCIEQ